jgi:hypothetical protein
LATYNNHNISSTYQQRRHPLVSLNHIAMGSASAMSTFPLFPLFPAELRNMIWEESLPQDLGVCLFPYQPGLWQPRQLLPGDEHFDPEDETLNLQLEYRSHTLSPIRLDLLLAFVNHEAGHVAQRWLRRNNMKLLPHGGHPFPLATRAF